MENCIICKKKFEHKSKNHKIDRRRITCSRDCARIFARVYHYAHHKIKRRLIKEMKK